jgi:flagellar assembly protein FliH
MPSKIIRGDGRALKLKVTSGGALNGGVSEDTIMNVEKQAFEQGYLEGERIGKQMGETIVATICKRYEQSIAELAGFHRQMQQEMEEQTVRLAIEIARKIVRRELTVDPDLLTALAVAALKRVSGQPSITLQVSNDDFERVSVAVAAVNPGASVKADPAMERGDFLIETGQTYMDGRLGSQIDAISKALFDEA